MDSSTGSDGGRSADGSALERDVTLVVNEVFTSLQGETTEAGRPCTFVRLTACDLRCTWCDSAHAFHAGSRRSLPDVLLDVARRGVGFVTVTGGEPLLQPACLDLVRGLLDAGHEVQVETGGHRDITGLDRRARIIVDLKAPGSGESARMRWENLALLSERDQVKMVLADRSDYDWARSILRDRLGGFAGAVLLQPVTGLLSPSDLADWIVQDRLPVRFCLQLHQLLWPGQVGR